MTWQGQYFSAQMCYAEKDIDSLYHFSEGPGGGFAYYRSQIPAPIIWPMAVLLDVEVPPKSRRQGAGTAAVSQFVDEARTNGAVLAFLRVGWNGEMEERDWRVAWYRRIGWSLLQNPVEYLVIPFMYREL